MSEAQTQATPEAPATQAPQAQPSPLEKVYQDYKIEETAQTFQPQTPQAPAQPATQTQPQAPKVDPFDPNFGNLIGEQVKQVSTLNQTVSEAVNRVTQLERSLIAKQTESDIKSAAQVIAEKAGIKPKVAEVAMEVKAREDARFRSVWQNRHANPKAFNAALEALAQEAAQEYVVKQDPQLAENQRAVKVSQQQMATTTKTSEQDGLDKMTPAERQQHLRRQFASGR